MINEHTVFDDDFTTISFTFEGKKENVLEMFEKIIAREDMLMFDCFASDYDGNPVVK